jgi:hypothetical protein
VSVQIRRLSDYERECLSETTRVLLCDFAAGDLERPLHRLDADWEQVFHSVCRNGLLGLTQRYLLYNPSEVYPPPAFRRWVRKAHRTGAVRMLFLYQHIQPVLSAMTASGVDYMVVKGPALAHTVYPGPAMRAFNDLDLVVRERDWLSAHTLLVDMGFVPEKGRLVQPPKLIPQDTIYERKYLHPETDLLVEVHYDDLLNAGLVSRDVEGFWDRAVWTEVEGVRIKTLSLEDSLIHLCVHAHYHGYTRLDWLSDMAFIVRDHGDRLDWRQMVGTVRVEEAQVGVYYSLCFLQALLGVDVPGDVLAALLPGGFRRWLHERYLPGEKVLSLEPLPRPDFSFYFVPLLKRMLPDLMVMGRRREKLRYLLRLLVPPAVWLRHHYRLGDASPIAPHYLLHPLKLAYHYGGEIVRAIGSRLQSPSRPTTVPPRAA